jgi:hypothetical protein
MSQPSITLLEQRRLQAQVLEPLFVVLCEELGRGRALALLGRAIERAALQAGRQAASQDPGGPNLEHFATLVRGMAAGGALELEGPTLEGRHLSYRVRRCRYLEMYAEMGLDPELAYTISCHRDEPFARGYHPGLHMQRPACLGRGDPECRFVFTWEEGKDGRPA